MPQRTGGSETIGHSAARHGIQSARAAIAHTKTARAHASAACRALFPQTITEQKDARTHVGWAGVPHLADRLPCQSHPSLLRLSMRGPRREPPTLSSSRSNQRQLRSQIPRRDELPKPVLRPEAATKSDPGYAESQPFSRSERYIILPG